MDKNIQIQKNYTSAAKRKWISRIIAVAVILVSMTVMFLFISLRVKRSVLRILSTTVT